MKFGIFYELQLPRPWEPHSEFRLYQNALDQVSQLFSRLLFEEGQETEIDKVELIGSDLLTWGRESRDFWGFRGEHATQIVSDFSGQLVPGNVIICYEYFLWLLSLRSHRT